VHLVQPGLLLAQTLLAASNCPAFLLVSDHLEVLEQTDPVFYVQR
jgi:hypothetical protein